MVFYFNQGHFKELVLVAKQGIIGWAQSNTQTILEVAESLWHIIRTNLSMIMGVTGEILSLLLSGGQACIEFILDMVSIRSMHCFLLLLTHISSLPDCLLHCLVLSAVQQPGEICAHADNQIHGIFSFGHQGRRCIGEFHNSCACVHVQVLHLYGSVHVAGAYGVRCTHSFPALRFGCVAGGGSIFGQLLVCCARLFGALAGTGSFLCGPLAVPITILCTLVL